LAAWPKGGPFCYEGQIAPDALARATSVAAELVRLETLAKEGPAAVRPIMRRLTERLQGARYDSLRRALTVWFVRVLLGRLMPGETLPEIQDFREVETMLAEHVEEWTRKWKREGERESRREGEREGKLEGKREALKRLLAHRFGELPAWASSRIDAATGGQVDVWLDGILDATSSTDLLGPEQAPPH
jgi:hypothetical protein